jgi:hypothetical protein
MYILRFLDSEVLCKMLFLGVSSVNKESIFGDIMRNTGRR